MAREIHENKAFEESCGLFHRFSPHAENLQVASVTTTKLVDIRDLTDEQIARMATGPTLVPMPLDLAPADVHSRAPMPNASVGYLDIASMPGMVAPPGFEIEITFGRRRAPLEQALVDGLLRGIARGLR